MRIRRTFLLCLLLLAGCGSPPADLLIRDVNVIDPGGNLVMMRQCVAVRATRILRVGRCDADLSATVIIDGSGKWLLPGLFDMHVHALWDESLLLPFFNDFLAFGVTGVRDMASQPATLAAARQRIAAGELPPLLLVASGPVVDGQAPVMPSHSLRAADDASAREAVATLDAMDVDFVKPYSLLPREAALAVLDEARRRRLPVAGHLPGSLTAADAIAGRMASIEHLAVGVGGLCKLDDEDDCLRTFRDLAAGGVHLTPTLLIRKRRSELDQQDFHDAARVAAMPAMIADDWRARRAQRLERLSPADWGAAREQYADEQRYTELAIKAGSWLLAGTDAGDLYVPPGLSLHDELELLVAAGLDEMQALASATSRPAAFLGMIDAGRIAAGARANLLLLNANPLDDIHASRDIAAVMLEGQWYDEAAIACLKARPVRDCPATGSR